MNPSRVLVTVQIATQADWVPSHAAFEEWVNAALASGGAGEVTIRIVDEEESAALNARYRDKPEPTNVLAFPSDAELLKLDPQAPLGDLVVCAPLVEQEAAAQHKTIDAHWAHLIVHGTLHLAGYDHDTAKRADDMERIERAVLGEFGISDPYAG